MSRMIKSPNDGRWYPDSTDWSLIRLYLCACLSSFSEFDSKYPPANSVYNFIEGLIGTIDTEFSKK